jgi:hypothetical protein
MNKLLVGLAVAAVSLFAAGLAEEPKIDADYAQSLDRLEGDYLYKVTLLRAAPGKLPELLDWYAAMKVSGYYKAAGEREPILMRHSQGDQWDLLVLAPMEGWFSYYAPRRGELRDQAEKKFRELLNRDGDLVAYAEDLFAWGPNIADLTREIDGKRLFHIEMFAALAGKRGELYRQRRMENEYLSATGQTPNMIFSVEAGGDVDVFTIGAHENLATFAAPAPVNDEEKELAAKAAGFKDRADISFLLRRLINSHHDTLATSVE